jgi:hypothetical protein
MHRTGIRVAAAAILACCGCDSYATLAAEPRAVGTDVRVTLVDGSSFALNQELGGSARAVTGHLREVTDSSLVVAVTDVTRLDGADDRWNGESVTIPRSGVETLEQKKTAIGRSVAIGVAIVGGALLLGNALGNGQAVGSRNPGPGQGGVQ